MRAALAAPSMSDLRLGYGARRYKPIWIASGRAIPEATELVRRLETSAEDGLDPEHYHPAGLRAVLAKLPTSTRAQTAQAELLLSKTFADYVADLHSPIVGADMAFTDADLAPGRLTKQIIVSDLAAAASPQAGVASATRMNALYLQFHDALRNYRAGAAPDLDTERLMLINLERLRALPPDLGPRFVLVDAAAQRLWLYERGQPVDTMKVVVGTPQEPTPAMVGVIRYAVFNPNWNVPPDLTQKTYAPRIRASPAALNSLQMDAWSSFKKDAVKLDPKAVDWLAVSRGEKAVWLRQRPGPDNSMGAVKFMLPNDLGIYLHDTPNKALFSRSPRAFSAGCVRVEDYQRLARWLFRRDGVGPKNADPEQRIDLPGPIPVYITYLTAALEEQRLALRPDIYGRDKALLAQMPGVQKPS